MTKKYTDYYNEISATISKKQIYTDDLKILAYGTDAGCYRKLPKIVIKVNNETEIVDALRAAQKNKVAVTFRAAGTSLSGQAISDSVLLLAAGSEWQGYEITDNGNKIRLKPGITGQRANIALQKYGKIIGPDPASVNSAMIGGIVANNASGMSCGTHANSYATLDSVKLVFADGTRLDTANSESRNEFAKIHKNLYDKIAELRDRIRKNSALKAKIKRKYKIKNTTGYGLNSFIDFEDPIDIIAHLMVGSEGTLAFISEVVFRTIDAKPYKSTGFIYFESLEEAGRAVVELKKINVSAIELIDRYALKAVEGKAGMPDFLKDLDDGVTALLIENMGKTTDEVEQKTQEVKQLLSGLKTVRPVEFTSKADEIVKMWKVRKGIFPAVGGMRPVGTTVIIEDVAFPMEHIVEGILDIRKMLDKYNYTDAIIYGHALDGNIHFVFNQDFNDTKEVERYEKLIAETCDIVVNKYDGSLKAEHGTGINMSPFVEMEWGKEAYQIMKELKLAFDPEIRLNPGVLINENNKAHLQDFKPMPATDIIIDKCIECGFCEINCLSREFALTARQRIVIQREISKLRKSGKNPQRLQTMLKNFETEGDETCAGDGLCAISCPVDIDTGVLIKKLRAINNQDARKAQKQATWVANNMHVVTSIMSVGLNFAHFAHTLFGTKLMFSITKAMRYMSGNNIPQWNKSLPRGAKSPEYQQVIKSDAAKVVYFPSCISRTMGAAKGDPDKDALHKITIKVLKRAGFEISFPDNMKKMCCGMPWESKGFVKQANEKSAELENALLKASNNGEYPVLFDTSPCMYRMIKYLNSKNSIKIYEPAEFIHDYLFDKLNFSKINAKIAVHSTCSTTKMDKTTKLIAVAKRCASDVVVPIDVGCCGFAGDKGFNLPELNKWALRNLKKEVEGCQTGYSNSRTCEIGLTEESGIYYKSIMYLVEKSTRDTY